MQEGELVLTPLSCLTLAQRNVAVRATTDAQGKLLRKPDLKKPEAPVKKLFDEAEQEQQQQALEEAASPSPSSAAAAAPAQPAASLKAAQ